MQSLAQLCVASLAPFLADALADPAALALLVLLRADVPALARALAGHHRERLAGVHAELLAATFEIRLQTDEEPRALAVGGRPAFMMSGPDCSDGAYYCLFYGATRRWDWARWPRPDPAIWKTLYA